MANINKIKLSGTTYEIQDLNATKTVELTQAEYDALSPKDPNVFYIITDATAGDLSNYYTKSETSGATEISTELESKADTATTYTKTETDNAITAATSTKQDTLVSGTNIKTINGETLLGEGNITIEGGSGGGKAINAGTNISVTTGETADTINCTLPIRTDGNYSGKGIILGKGNNMAAKGAISIVGGSFVSASTNAHYSVGFGNFINLSNEAEFSCGEFSKTNRASSTFGDSGNTLFSVGNGTADNARHNAFEIRQNGDIYITKDGQDVKLQDQLGGGGSITIDPSLDSGSTNPVANSAITNAINDKVSNIYRDTTNWVGSGVTSLNVSYKVGSSTIKTYCASINNKPILTGSDHTKVNKFSLVETSAITTSITSESTDSQVPSAKSVYDQFGGLKLVKLTQSEYDSLTTKDNSTLYVIVN